MKKFLDKNFLLTTKAAEKIYHEGAADCPIFDYHCHLNPQEIADNRRWDNLAEIWLGGDHYKWRAMRANGIDERLITGDAAPFDKFNAWAQTVPRLVGNPLYHWTHLELRRYFDIKEPLSGGNAREVWDEANRQLKNDPAFCVHGIFKKFRVHTVGTTDDPADDLASHAKVRAENRTPTKVIPSWRPDKALNIDKEGFTSYIKRLGGTAGIVIDSLDTLFAALDKRLDFFDRAGCRASDHALEYPPFVQEADAAASAVANAAFKKALDGVGLSREEADAYKTCVLIFLAGHYREKNWAMQLHFAALRSANSRMLAALGHDTGYDAVHDHDVSANLALLFDAVEKRGGLPKTILYTLNPKDYYPLATIAGVFQGGLPGKVQLGSAWWFLDNRDGIEEQLSVLSNTGLLSHFIGMLTDSRSFLSYTRHEYFRRILCNLIGRWADAGEIPNDYNLLLPLVRGIAFDNAKEYFSA